MSRAALTVDAARAIGDVDPRLFGSFVEHLGRCVYTGIYEPGHPRADERGFRLDVLELVRELGVSVVRYPGGNFVSGYDWEDGVGPVDQRPARLDLAWHSLEPNHFGTDEFVDWARLAGVEPMLVVNLGTRGIDAARSLVEYCNHPGGTAWSDLRARNGRSAPHGVRLWCLGNEMDGPWQIGHKTAEEYGRCAAETAKAMKLVDPSIELVACGSSNSGMPTFGTWEATVLEHCHEHVEYISLHAYYREEEGDLASFLASSTDMDSFIESVVEIADRDAAARGESRQIDLAFDEWNVWYWNRWEPPSEWAAAPRLLEDVYSVADALVVGTLLITLLRHADRVKVACLAQLVNVIAPIMTEPGGPAWRQTIFHPFAHVSRFARGGTVLRHELEGPSVETERFGSVDALEAAAVADRAAARLALFVVNRHQTDAIALDAELRGFDELELVEHIVLRDDDVYATSTASEPERVRPVMSDTARLERARLSAKLPPLSWNVVLLRESRRD